mgnify:CR=1 FL=1
MNHLFQPVYEYDKDIYVRKVRMKFVSSIVYETEEQAKISTLNTWDLIKENDETLVNITFNELIIHYQ